MHFTPTSASWINQVERLTRKKLQRGVHTSIGELEADIQAFIDRGGDMGASNYLLSASEISLEERRSIVDGKSNAPSEPSYRILNGHAQ